MTKMEATFILVLLAVYKREDCCRSMMSDFTPEQAQKDCLLRHLWRTTSVPRSFILPLIMWTVHHLYPMSIHPSTMEERQGMGDECRL
mmetsp:Transcript_9581/g.14061  ORF Transcript_9581/g.14061 Transcript_9581/m.14061 type:complete len:88 (-) Transcript_9581:273-536(-)